MRNAQRELAIKIRDVGFLPEDEIHRRSAGSTPYEIARDRSQYDPRKVMEAAEIASMPGRNDEHELIERLSDEDSAVRYWAAMGLLIRGERLPKNGAGLGVLSDALADPSPSVRVMAAQALAEFTNSDLTREQSLKTLLEHADLSRSGLYVSLLALNALDELDDIARPIKASIARLPHQEQSLDPRLRNYVDRLLEKTLADLN
jgi:uncharacterized sulfatase